MEVETTTKGNENPITPKELSPEVFDTSTVATPYQFEISIKVITSDGTVNGTNPIQLRVKRTDLIAAVKYNYIKTGKCETPDYIVLQYNGKELDDLTTVWENDIQPDSVIFHTYANITPFTKIDYGQVAENARAEALKKKDYNHAGFDPHYGVWDYSWEKGSEWESYPTVLVSSMEENQSAIIPKQPPFNPMQNANTYPGRVFKSMIVSSVGGFLFETIHRLEGTWSESDRSPAISTTTSFPINPIPSESASPIPSSPAPAPSPVPDPMPSSMPRSTSHLRFDPHGFWVETRTSVASNGMATTRTIRYIPISNGRLRVEMSDGMYADCRIEASEISPYMLLITAVNIRTGMPILLETIVLVGNGSTRIRSIQDYSCGNGNEMCEVYIINETRVTNPSAAEITPFNTRDQLRSI